MKTSLPSARCIVIPSCLLMFSCGGSGTTAPVNPTPSPSPPPSSPTESPTPTPPQEETTPGDWNATPTPTATPPDPSRHCSEEDDIIVIEESEIWALADSPHRVCNEIRVEGEDEPILTIEAGVEVIFEEETGLSIGLSAPGGLLIEGTADAPIRLDADVPGTWLGVSIGQNALASALAIEHAELLNGGNPEQGALRAYGVPPRVQSTTISGWSGYGFTLTETGFASDSADLIVTGNDGRPGRIDAAFFHTLPTGSYSGNGEDVLEISDGRIDESVYWADPGIPLLLNTNLDIIGIDAPILTLGQGITLFIEPFEAYGIYVGFAAYDDDESGGMSVEGTQEAPVLLAPYEATEPGAWAGILFGAKTIDESSRWEHFIIDYAGGNGNAYDFHGAVECQSGRPTLQEGTIRNSASCGVAWYEEDDAPILIDMSYENNAGTDVYSTEKDECPF